MTLKNYFILKHITCYNKNNVSVMTKTYQSLNSFYVILEYRFLGVEIFIFQQYMVLNFLS